MRGPWGIVVTRTLHLPDFIHGEGWAPMCQNPAVEARLAEVRERRRAGDTEAWIVGETEGRPVCRDCIRAAERRIGHLRRMLAEVNTYERSRP